jgi:putative aldouronate transport system substrate-binding protein
MKRATRVIVTTLVLSMLLATMSGCGKKATTGSAQKDGADGVTTLDMFIDMTWYWTDKWKGVIPEAITEKTGVAFNLTRAADDKQLGLMIASNSLPDIVFTGSDSEKRRLSNSDLCYSWEELIAQYAPNWNPDPERVKTGRYLSTDGKFYTLLTNFESTELWREAPIGAPIVVRAFYRKDLMDQLGNPAINSPEDFANVLVMAKEKFPDVIPFTFNTDEMTSLFKSWFGVTNDLTGIYDNKHMLSMDTKQHKDVIAYMNKLYQNGCLIAENFALANGNEARKYPDSAKAFVYVENTMDPSSTLDPKTQQVVPEATWAALPNIVGDKLTLVKGSNGWAGTFITKKCKNPEAAIKFLEFMFSEEGYKLGQWGREGIEWTVGANGIPQFSDEWLEAAKDEKIQFEKYNPSWLFGNTAISEGTGRALNMTPELEAINKEIRQAIVINPAIDWSLPQADTDERIILDKIQVMLNEEVPRCILSKTDAEFEANYANMIAHGKQIGSEKLNEFLNTTYQRVIKE